MQDSKHANLTYLAQPDEPVAYINGTFGGRVCIRLIKESLVMPEGMALYAAQPDQSERIELLEQRLKAYSAEHEPVAWRVKDQRHGRGYIIFQQYPSGTLLDIEPLYVAQPAIPYARVAELTKQMTDIASAHTVLLVKHHDLEQQLAAKDIEIDSLVEQIKLMNDADLQAREPVLLKQAEIEKIADAKLIACAEIDILEGTAKTWVEGQIEFARAIEVAHGIKGE